ncbi:microfibril-associated glycoprotein 4-like [Osmerus eperlanus]|uniref:microfibril-associated glycoprotein 4-like n=1 Tax=Osmerus eperlanus TaxID=29151 RepID=UPI002E0FDEEF
MKVLVLLAAVFSSVAQSLMFQPLDCADIYNAGSGSSGVYRIYPAGPNSPTRSLLHRQSIYCLSFSPFIPWSVSPWLQVFLARMDGTVNFYRGWDQYKNGFGHAAGEYWLGLETIHLLTTKKDYELRVDMEDFEGRRVYANYSSFSISPGAVNAEVDLYKLHVSGFRDGGAGDSLAPHNGRPFSTFDRDNDANSGNCALTYMGAFWYNNCFHASPTGVYMWGADDEKSSTWYTFKSNYYSLKSISMKIRPVTRQMLVEKKSWLPPSHVLTENQLN